MKVKKIFYIDAFGDMTMSIFERTKSSFVLSIFIGDKSLNIARLFIYTLLQINSGEDKEA